MDATKKQRYEAISREIVRLVGGKENILGIAHCATRLRLVLADNDKANIGQIEDVDLVKGVFVAGDQLQIIFGTGIVNDICQVLAGSIHMNSMSLGDLKSEANTRMNPIQRAVKALSDVFIEIMPGILVAALLTGLSSVLGNLSFVEENATLYGITKLINISSGAIGGAIVYFTNLAALGFGTTVVPGIALVDPAGNGYVNYILAHLAALAAGFIFTVVLAAVFTRQPQLAEADAPVADRLVPAQDSTQATEETVAAFGNGHLVDITRVNDATFAQKVLGDGVAIQTEDGKVYAPVDAVIEDIMDAKHAIGLRSNSGHELLIHAGIDTVQLGGQYFTTHVKAGETVKKGTLLLTFDQNKIQQAGYDTIVSLLITEMANGFTLAKTEECDVKVGQTIAQIVKM